MSYLEITSKQLKEGGWKFIEKIEFPHLRKILFIVNSQIEVEFYIEFAKKIAIDTEIVMWIDEVSGATISLIFLEHFQMLKRLEIKTVYSLCDERYIGCLELLENLFLINSIKGGISLSFLKRLQRLTHVHIFHHSEEIESLGFAGNLKYVQLEGCKIKDAAFLENLSNLVSLTFRGGTLGSTVAIRNQNLKYLHVENMKTFDFGKLALQFPSLESIYLRGLKSEEIPELKGCPFVRELSLSKMLNLKDLSALRRLPYITQIGWEGRNVKDLLDEIRSDLPPDVKLFKL